MYHLHRYVKVKGRCTHDSFAVASSSLLVLAAEEQPVPLLLQLLCGGALLRAAGHLLHRLRGARLALLPYPVPRLFGWLADRLQNAPSLLGLTDWIGETGHVSLGSQRAFTAVRLQCVSRRGLRAALMGLTVCTAARHTSR